MKKRLFVILLSLAVMVGLSFTAWAVDGAVAKIGDQEYTSLGDAVAAVPADGTQTTITLLKNAAGGGVQIKAGQNIHRNQWLPASEWLHGHDEKRHGESQRL